MTIQELYELIKQKKENAEIDRERQHNLFLKVKREDKATDGEILKKYFELKGEIDAYTDVICLIESSGVLNGNISVDLDALNILMKYREIHVYKYKNDSCEMELWGDLTNKITQEEYEKLKWYIAIHKKLDL